MQTATAGAKFIAADALPAADFTPHCRMVRALLSVSVAEIHIATVPGPASVDRWVDTAPGVDPQRCAFIVGEASFGAQRDGRLCLRDFGPRRLSDAECRHLETVAALAGQSLNWWQSAVAAAAREAEFRLLAENSTDTIVRGDLNGVRLYVSPSVKSLLGYEAAELIGKQAAELLHPDDAPAFGALMQRIRAGLLDVGVSEMRQRHRDGTWVWMEASIKLIRDPVSGDATGYVASVRGIGPRKQAEARLEHLASHDDLTGLPNRALLNRRLDEAVAHTRRSGQHFALFGMDLDGFKPVNDTLGHQAGDTVLREVANRLRAVIRPDDTIARLGGDEFALIQAIKTDVSEAAMVAERLIRAVSAPFLIDGRAVSIGLSIGIASTAATGTDPDELLSAADRALYQAKTGGRNRFCFADSAVL